MKKRWKELKETQDIEINENNEDIISDKNDVEKDQFYENDNNEIAINKKVEDIRNKKI